MVSDSEAAHHFTTTDERIVTKTKRVPMAIHGTTSQAFPSASLCSMAGGFGGSAHASSSRYPMMGEPSREAHVYDYQHFTQPHQLSNQEHQQQQHMQQRFQHPALDPSVHVHMPSYPGPSVATTDLAISPTSSESTSSSYARPQKRTRPRRRPALSPHRGGRQVQPDQEDDEDDESDTDREDDPSKHGYSHLPATDQLLSGESPHRPPKKRMHLDQEDVGRFAEMSIFEGGSSLPRSPVTARPRGRTLHRTSNSIPTLSQPRAPPASPAPSDRQRLDGLFGMSAIEQGAQLQSQELAPPATPAEQWVEDAHMSAEKPPSSWDVDRYTTYVHSLDEDDDGEPGEGDESTAHQKATIPISRQEAEELQNRVHATRSSEEGPSSAYEINPELLAKLEAHSRSVLIDGDMSRRRSSAPSTEETKNALILWKGPEQLFEYATDGSPSPMSPLPDVVVSGSGPSASTPGVTPVFAFGSVETPSPGFSPSFAPRRNVSGSSSTSASSMSVTPLGSPRVTFTQGSGMEVDESG